MLPKQPQVAIAEIVGEDHDKVGWRFLEVLRLRFAITDDPTASPTAKVSNNALRMMIPYFG